MQAVSSQIAKNVVGAPALGLSSYFFTATVHSTRRNWRLFYSYLLLPFVSCAVILTAAYFVASRFDSRSFLANISKHIGFSINHLNIQGNSYFTKTQLVSILGLDKAIFLPSFDVSEARSRLLTFPWVKEAVVEKVYPDKLNVQLIERQPYAVLQQGSRFALIDADGVFIRAVDVAGRAGLPLILAQELDSDVMRVMEQIKSHTIIANRVKSYVNIADRRWNLLLNNDVLIKLPAVNAFAALSVLLRYPKLKQLLDEPGISIDLRNKDIIVVAPKPAPIKVVAHAV